MKKMYEKPVATILRMENSIQIMSSSGFESKESFNVNKWDKTDEINANGTSDSLKVLPDWLK